MGAGITHTCRQLLHPSPLMCPSSSIGQKHETYFHKVGLYHQSRCSTGPQSRSTRRYVTWRCTHTHTHACAYKAVGCCCCQRVTIEVLFVEYRLFCAYLPGLLTSCIFAVLLRLRDCQTAGLLCEPARRLGMLWFTYFGLVEDSCASARWAAIACRVLRLLVVSYRAG